MNLNLSKFYIYTSHPLQEFEQDTEICINTLRDISKNNYDNILIIIGGSLWNYNDEYDILCKNLRLSLQNYAKGKNLIINLDGDVDNFKINDNLNNTYIHLKIFLSYDLNCPFNIELFKFINKYLESKTNIYVINSVFEYSCIISCKKQINNVFKGYINTDNFHLLNVVVFPTNDDKSKYESSIILSNLILNNPYEFKIWKELYRYKFGDDYNKDIRSNNLKTITYNDFLLYYFNKN